MSPYRTRVPVSSRAERYLATLARVPAEDDPERIGAALEAAGAPALDVWVDFQRRYGGLVQMHGFNRLEWGLLHPRPHPLSPFSPDQVDASVDGAEILVSCCSCHASDHWQLDERGQLHWCFPSPVASSFEMHVEREALWWEIARTSGRLRAIDLGVAEGARQTLLANLRPHLVPEVSDACVSVYRNEGVIAVLRSAELRVYVTGKLSRAALRGVPYAIPFSG